MLNCSTCHKQKPEAHFYANPSHRAHVPLNASPEDAAALARLLADGLLPASAASQTPTASQATLARARQRLATSGRPDESPAQRRQREAAQARAVEREEEEEARQAEADAEPLPLWMKITGVGGLLALVAGYGYALWRDTHA